MMKTFKVDSVYTYYLFIFPWTPSMCWMIFDGFNADWTVYAIAFGTSIFIFLVCMAIYGTTFKTIIINNDAIYSQNFLEKKPQLISYFQDVIKIENYDNQSIMIIEKNKRTVLHLIYFKEKETIIKAIKDVFSDYQDINLNLEK